MAKHPVELPRAAMDGMSETAKHRLAEHAPHVITNPAEPAPIFHHNTTANDIFTGTDGVVDYFVFDMSPLDLLGPQDHIFNFDAEDHLVFVNTQGAPGHIIPLPVFLGGDGDDWLATWDDPVNHVTHSIVQVLDTPVVPTLTLVNDADFAPLL